ncbi:MAG TPA: RidA family protein [Amaricoccus sp.]|jgi:enamine deaminase RidA (YjgF/YER057c/UK114 family)|nr:RidA family protein [Amaricoccus sp.]
MSKIKRFESGPRMSKAVRYGDTIYLAGQVGTGATVAEQAKSALAEVERVLELAGGSKSTILSVTVWLADMNDFAEMNAVYDAWVDPENKPARAAGEAKLATPDYRVEFIVVAARA